MKAVVKIGPLARRPSASVPSSGALIIAKLVGDMATISCERRYSRKLPCAVFGRRIRPQPD